MHPDAAVQQIIDRQAITDTLYRYASAIDVHDYATVRQQLTDDAAARYGDGDWIVGGDQIIDWIQSNSGAHSWEHHLLSVYHVDIDGDTATTLTYHTSHRIKADDPTTASVIVARYHDELRRVGDSWKIARKSMEIGWRGTR